jgi:hypothetical protein
VAAGPLVLKTLRGTRAAGGQRPRRGSDEGLDRDERQVDEGAGDALKRGREGVRVGEFRDGDLGATFGERPRLAGVAHDDADRTVGVEEGLDHGTTLSAGGTEDGDGQLI